MTLLEEEMPHSVGEPSEGASLGGAGRERDGEYGSGDDGEWAAHRGAPLRVGRG